MSQRPSDRALKPDPCAGDEFMKLHEALRKIILEYGPAVLEERSLVSLLEGSSAFEDCPDMLPVMEALFTPKYGHELSLRSAEPERTDLSLYLDYLGKSLVNALGFGEKQADYAVYSVSYALGLCPDAPDPIDITAGQRDPFEECAAGDSGEPEWQMVGPDDAPPQDEKVSPEHDSAPEQANRLGLTCHPQRQRVPVMSHRHLSLMLPLRVLPRMRLRSAIILMTPLLTAPETPRRGTLKRCLSRPLRQNQQSAPESLVITLRQSHLPEMLPLRQSPLPSATRTPSFMRGGRCTATGAERDRTTPRR